MAKRGDCRVSSPERFLRNPSDFPGHFLIRMEKDGERVILDPFKAGKEMNAAELRHLLKSIAGKNAELSHNFYLPVENRDMLVRLENNLKKRRLPADFDFEPAACAKVMHDAGKKVRSLNLEGADRKVHRKKRSVFALPLNIAADANDLVFACRHVVRQVTIVARPMRLWHEHFDIFPNYFSFGVAEQLNSRRIDGLNRPFWVNRNNGPHR